VFRRTGDAIHGREGRPAASSLEYKATASCNSTVEVRVLKKQAAHPSRTPLPQYDVPVARMSVVYRACLALCVNANGQHAKQHRRHEGPGCTCVHHWVLGVSLVVCPGDVALVCRAPPPYAVGKVKRVVSASRGEPLCSGWLVGPVFRLAGPGCRLQCPRRHSAVGMCSPYQPTLLV